MRIKNAQAGLILKDVVITDLSIKNQLFQYNGIFNENNQMMDMDYNVLEIIDSDDNQYIGKLELTTIINVKENKKTVFNLKISHLGLIAAPKISYETTSDFVKAVELNGLASLVSFARAEISTITAATFSQGNIVLPMINIFSLQKLKEASQETPHV